MLLIREKKSRKTRLPALSVQNQPKFYRKFVRPLYCLLGSFCVMGPNIRLVGNTDIPGKVSDGKRSPLKGLSHEIDFKNFDKNLQNLA